MNQDPQFSRALAALARHTHAESILDFGAGNGLYDSYLAKVYTGASEIVGVEPIPTVYKDAMKVSNARGMPKTVALNILDEAARGQAPLRPKYDFVFSNEVVEHIEKSQHRTVFDFLANKTSKLLVFGMATRGQGGTGHIACRHPSEVLSVLVQNHGLRHLPNVTAALHRIGGFMPTNRLAFSNDPDFADDPGPELREMAIYANSRTSPMWWKSKTFNAVKERHQRGYWPALSDFVDRVRKGEVACDPTLIG